MVNGFETVAISFWAQKALGELLMEKKLIYFRPRIALGLSVVSVFVSV